LECRGITFERDDVPLFSGVNFSLYPSRAVQITGANGAGKTTLLRIIAGSLMATEGDILWAGQSTRKQAAIYHSQLLYLGHSAGVKLSLTPRENLQWYFRLFPARSLDIDNALLQVSLQGYEDVPCYSLSAGQQRRVALARLYLSSASLWVLDEPFTSIDVHGVVQLEELMKKHCTRGGALILTTHQQLGLDDIEVLELEAFACDY